MALRGTKVLSAACAGLAWLSLPAVAEAQSLRDEVRQQAADDHIGTTFQSLSIFNGTPGISAATYYADGLDLNTFKVPLSHSFEPFEGGLFNGVSLYTELTLGYLRGTESYDYELVPGAGQTEVDATYQAFTGLAGIGLDFPVGEAIIFRPIFLAGYSYLESDASYSGPYAQLLKEATEGILFDFHINSVLLGGALELEYGKSFSGDLNLDTTLRYNQIVDIGYEASDPVLEETGNFGVVSGWAELNGPTDIKLFGRDIRWIGFTGANAFTGEQSDALGFEYFFEFGGGIELVDPEVVQGLQGVSLRSSAIVGDNVTGWTVGLALEF